MFKNILRKKKEKKKNILRDVQVGGAMGKPMAVSR